MASTRFITHPSSHSNDATLLTILTPSCSSQRSFVCVFFVAQGESEYVATSSTILSLLKTCLAAFHSSQVSDQSFQLRKDLVMSYMLDLDSGTKILQLAICGCCIVVGPLPLVYRLSRHPILESAPS